MDDRGRVLQASGVAAEPVMQQRLLDRLARLRDEPVGAFCVESPQPALVTYRAVGLGTAVFVEPDPAQDPAGIAARQTLEDGHFRGEPSDSKHGGFDLGEIVGSSEAIQQLKSDLVRIAPLHVPVLIVGESGTGKELAALAIHALSMRRDNRMIFVNAAALPGGLVESELFGYEPGAFTGAERVGRKGKFELANRSSLFFDEIGDMPGEIQVKLLRVLQDGVFERVGGGRPLHSDFRLICASNRNFQQMISAGAFRLDLYYRISGVTIRMPSLRERLEDIPELVRCFLTAFAKRHRTAVKSVDARVYDHLRGQPWPGNVRQLLHEVERAAIFCDGALITVGDFRRAEPAQPADAMAASPERAARGGRVRDAVDALELSMIRDAMARHSGNKKRAAEELGISRAYLYKKLSAT